MQGADVTALSQVSSEYTTTTVTLQADSSGVLEPGQFPLYLPLPKVLKGGVNITLNNETTYAIVNATANVAGISVDNTNGSTTKGQVMIPGTVTNTGSFTLTVYYNGLLVAAHAVSVAKKNAEYVPPPPPPAPGGTGPTVVAVYLPGSMNGGSATAPTFTNASALTVPAGRKITAVCAGTYYATAKTSGNTRVYLKPQYSVAGSGSWNDIDIFQGGSQSFTDAEGQVNDYGESNFSVSVAVAAGEYQVRVAFYEVGTGSLVWQDGGVVNFNANT
jgi:hypothetical protein